MALYKRSDYDLHTEAIEKASQCLSAAVAGDEYGGRLDAYLDIYSEIADLFKSESEGLDVQRAFHRVVLGIPMKGFECMKMQTIFDRAQRRCKSALMTTRMIASENDLKRKKNMTREKAKFMTVEED